MEERRRLAEAVKRGNTQDAIDLIETSIDGSGLAWDAVKEAIFTERLDIFDAVLPFLVSVNSAYPLVYAARKGMAHAVAKLIPLCNPLDEESLALSEAARLGHTEVVRLLLPVSDPLADESAALLGAARAGHTEIVTMLIPVSDPKDRESGALVAAASRGHVKVIKALLPVSSSIICATKVVPSVCDNGFTSIVRRLLKAKLPDPSETYTSGLNAAAAKGHVEIVELLLPAVERAGRPRRFGHTAIVGAAGAGHERVVERLAALVDKEACTHALVAALEAGHAQCAAELTRHADLDRAGQWVKGAGARTMLGALMAKLKADVEREAIAVSTPTVVKGDLPLTRL